MAISTNINLPFKTPNATGLTGRRSAKHGGNQEAMLLGGPVQALVGRLMPRLTTVYLRPAQ
jgi:hypothetical protein